jgi:DNA-binding transcriptional MerR regulator
LGEITRLVVLARRISQAGLKQLSDCPLTFLVLETREGDFANMEQQMPEILKVPHAKKFSDPVIPDKLYFRIGEVADLCDLPAYVLRFWETEFPQLKPTKSSTGQRMYRRRDVDNVLRIRKLLYQDGFTIAGARQQLRSEARAAGKTQPALPFPHHRQTELKRVRQGLREILGMLSARPH